MFKLGVKEGQINLTLCSCLGCDSPGCGKFHIYTAKLADVHSNVVTRLFLHSMFGREHILQGLVDTFEKGWNDDNTRWQSTGSKEVKSIEITSPEKVWHHIILSELEKDPTWNTCETCKTEYDQKSRAWEAIYFVAAPHQKCRDHKK